MRVLLTRLLLCACLAATGAAQAEIQEEPEGLEETPRREVAELRVNTPVLERASRTTAPVDRTVEYRRRRAVFEGARMRGFPSPAGSPKPSAGATAPADPLRWLKWLLTCILLCTSALSANAWLEGKRSHEPADDPEERLTADGEAEQEPRLHPDDAPDLCRKAARRARRSTAR